MSAWEPLRAGRAAAGLTRIAEEIGRELLAGGPRAFDVSSGAAGDAVLFACLARATGDGSWAEKAQVRLEEAVEGFSQAGRGRSLYGGYAGVAWAVEHVTSLLEPGGEDLNGDVDEVLAEHLADSPWREDYDLVSGLVGYGVYALERLPRGRGQVVLGEVVRRLAETAEERDGGRTWHTAPALLPPHQRALCPSGYYNLGLAHGVPGVVALLAEACAWQVEEALARPLLRDALRWLLAQRRLGPGPSRFASWIPSTGPSSGSPHSRLAWCYGDLGAAAALVLAGRRAGEETALAAGLDLALQAAARAWPDAGVVDAGLCHGAAGNAHVFNRLYQATGEPRLREAAVRWLDHALALRRPGEGVAGFPAWKEGWLADRGLLTGAGGVALAFLAAAAAQPSDWDRLLLVSLPPREPVHGR